MESSIRQILQQWENEKINQNTGALPDLIIEVENITGFKFPEEFKQLYTQVNGFFNYDWRENMFSVWPLERILEDYNNCDDKQFIGFADYLINSHQIGFLKTQPGIFKKNGATAYFAVSDSFIDAIKLINENSDLIY